MLAATQAVLAKNGVHTEIFYEGCCGMPQLEQGTAEIAPHTVQMWAVHKLSLFSTFVYFFRLLSII